jgi:hypothetical protein
MTTGPADPSFELVACPDPGCGAPAEVLDRFDLWSTDGPVHHLKTLCARWHAFTAPVATQPARPPIAAGVNRRRPPAGG